MPFNGTGMFVRLRNWVADATAGVKIRADYHDIEDDGFADGLSQCIARDGQSTIINNIPMNGKRLVALQDPADQQDAATRAYADTKLPLAGGTITGTLTVTGTITAAGYNARPGLAGAASANFFNFNYTGNLEAWVNTVKIGVLATQAYVETRAEAWAAQYAAPKVNRSGDTMTGSLTVNGELIAAANYLRFQYSGSPGFIIWNGGNSYSLGGGGVIWHQVNLPNPVTNGRLVYAGTSGFGPAMAEPYPGAVATGFSSGLANNPATAAQFRYVQLFNPNGWYTMGYA